MSTVQISLPKRLKSFEKADTSSASKGFVPAGTYAVAETKENHPTSETDYAKLVVPDLGEVWVCTRWQDNQYGEFETGSSPEEPEPVPDLIDVPTPEIDFSGDDKAVEETTLVEQLKNYDGYSHDYSNARYPYELPGINVKTGPPHQNNCCTFVEGLAVKAFADSFPDFKWNNKLHGQMMIFTLDEPFSPVEAVVENGMAEKVENVDEAPKPWTVIQGWKTQWTGGHTFFIVDHHKETDRVLTLESNMAYNLNGVGFRKIGMASDFGHKPPTNWWEREAVWTWEKMKEVYKFRAMATLKVKNRNWSGIA